MAEMERRKIQQARSLETLYLPTTFRRTILITWEVQALEGNVLSPDSKTLINTDIGKTYRHHARPAVYDSG